MKILQFTAPSHSNINSKKQIAKNNETDFHAALKKAEKTLAAKPDVAVRQENFRALELPPVSELGMAGQLLRQLQDSISAASSETLQNVHKLEGLIYIYNTKNKSENKNSPSL